ncbi:MAG: YrhB domain-containing protein [Rhodomicrobium sp.]
MIVERSDAIELVSKRLEEIASPNDQLIVIEEKTIERPFGWIFFYDSKKYIETGSTIHRLAGNGPVIVNKKRGSVDLFGSTPPLEEILSRYERSLQTGD